MNIADIQFSIETSSLEIYLAGCNPPHCPSCHNPELHDFNIGLNWRLWCSVIEQQVEFFDSMCLNIWVLGGEPLDQDNTELIALLCFLKTFNKQMWLFTRRNIGQIPSGILDYCDYVKTGRYKPDLGPGSVEYGVELATANQHIVRIKRVNNCTTSNRE